MEAQLQYKFDVFEGPLDLLLSLISKNKIDIYDIQISELLDQYMEQIAQMRENRMDIASEFLTMASRLVYIKSVMLLPKYEEEAEELKKELTGQLLEYAVCREIAAKLGGIYDFDRQGLYQRGGQRQTKAAAFRAGIFGHCRPQDRLGKQQNHSPHAKAAPR